MKGASIRAGRCHCGAVRFEATAETGGREARGHQETS